MEGRRVLITSGGHADQEGVCLGQTNDHLAWAVSPDGTDEILEVQFDEYFGLRICLLIRSGIRLGQYFPYMEWSGEAILYPCPLRPDAKCSVSSSV
jgi:hypothetical protein